MASGTNCNSKEHKMHMCLLKENGFDKKHPEKFKAITENPNYKCGNCGAEAGKAENLCNPVKL
jgi:hypothetical protein